MVGAGSGIGRAVAELFASRGIHTRGRRSRTGRREGARDPARRTSSPSATRAGTRLTRTRATSSSTRAVAALGSIDRVVSTVGWTAITSFLEETPDYWRRIIDVNLMSAIYLSASAGRVMKENGGGSIVLTSSEAGVVGTSGEAVYSAAKAGVVTLAKSLAREWARFGIRVNVVAPGVTQTPLLESQGGDALLASIVRAIPLRRAGTPHEIATAIEFMSSGAASYVTGQTLCVGGGLTMSS